MLQVWGYSKHGRGIEVNANCIPVIYRKYAEGASTFQQPYAYFISGYFGRFHNIDQDYTDWLAGIELPNKVVSDLEHKKCVLVVDDTGECFSVNEIRQTLFNFANKYNLNKDNFIFSTNNLAFPDLEFCDVYADAFMLEYSAYAIIDKDNEDYNTVLKNRGTSWEHRFINIGGEPRSHRIEFHNLIRSHYTDGISTINAGLRVRPEPGLFTPETSPYETYPQTESYIWHTINTKHFVHVPVASVMETYIDDTHTCVTEKAFKNLVYPQPFVMLGSANMIQYLRDLGFDVYDDYVDHSYDTIQDDHSRTQAVFKCFEKLIGKSEFPREKHIAEHNRNVARNLTIARDFIDYIKQKLVTK